FISTMVGIAIDEGKIKNETDLVSNYIPEYKGKAGWDKVTIRDVIQMSSGIKFQEGYYTPFSGAAAYYYGKNLRKRIQSLKIKYEPGKDFQYKSANTQILGVILENV